LKGVQTIVCGYNGFPDFLCVKDGKYWWVEVKNSEKYRGGETYGPNHYLRQSQREIKQELGLKGDIVLVSYGECLIPPVPFMGPMLEQNEAFEERADELALLNTARGSRLSKADTTDEILTAVAKVLADKSKFTRNGAIDYLLIQDEFKVGINQAYRIKRAVERKVLES
jgi:hypothetical protein